MTSALNDKGTSDPTPPQTPRKSTILLHPMESPVDSIGNAHGSYSSEQSKLLPSLNALPTPQSPNNLANYVPGLTDTPESPMSHISHSFASSRSLAESHILPDGTPKRSPLKSQQILTPDSSPFTGRFDTHNNHSSPATPRTLLSTSGMNPLTPSFTSPRRTPSPLPSSEPQSSHLSSPFMARSSLPDPAKARTSSQSSVAPNILNEAASTAVPAGSVLSATLISTPPISPLLAPGSAPAHLASVVPALAGGELDRIHQTMQQEHEELESRRPDYLKRSKRTISDADSTALMEDDGTGERDRFSSVGIMDSPMKGRRIKLFQETSEESFEESLMAGGYGRYRTAEWVRQPQPMVVNTETGAPVNVVAHLEEVQQEEPPPPPTEKELRKRKRLDAFRSSNSAASRLYPVDIEGKGRVLLDVPTERNDIETAAAASRRRTPGKRKRRAEPTAKERRAAAAAAAAEESAERPNWPDAEFPWRIRTEERAEQAKAEEEERLKWIEKFLDRDSDDENDEDGVSFGRGGADEEILPSSVWGVVYEDGDDRPVPYRPGRGKMVPLRGDPDQERAVQRRRNAFFPSDPADARAALLSKKTVRALSYRRQRARAMHRSGDASDDDEEILCICRGRDDGRELVQCDSCNTWYHLRCIGIEDVAELGPAEDKWYCFRCESESESPPSAETSVLVSEIEPTFVPTDESPRRRQADAQFYQPDSPTQWNLSIPSVPKTPTRGAANSSDFGSSFSSSTYPSSGHVPVTPRHQARDVRIIAPPSVPDDLYGFDDTQFDPTSTPSRGIKFGGPFATPKNSISSRSFHTPSRPSARIGPPGSATSFGAAGFLASALDERGGQDQSPYTYSRPHTYPSEDGSPIRRGGHRIRRIADSSSMPTSRVLFEESHRSKGRGRVLDLEMQLPETS